MRVHRVLNNNLRGARKVAEVEEEEEKVLRDVSELIVEGEVKFNEVHQGVSLREVKVNKVHQGVSLRELKDPHQRTRVEKDKVVLLGTKEAPLKAKVVSQEPQGVLQVVSQEVHPRVVNKGVHPRVQPPKG